MGRAGLIRPVRLPSGQRRYPVEEINRIFRKERDKGRAGRGCPLRPCLEHHLKYCGVEIEVTSQKELETHIRSWFRICLAIVTSFSARLYGARGGRKVRRGFRELIEDAEKAQKGEV